MEVFGAQYKYLKVVNTVNWLFLHYVLLVSASKRATFSISRVHSLLKARLAKMTAILTAVGLTSFALSFVVVIFGGAYSALCRSSYFRWSMLLSQLNSLFNSVLYCYKDRRERSAGDVKDKKTCSQRTEKEKTD